MKQVILAVILGAVVLFAWGFFSWVVLPWHEWASHQFSNEEAVSEVLQANAPQRGIYFLPYNEEDHEPGKVAAFVNVLPQGFDGNMPKMMVIGFILQMLYVFLVVLLLRKTAALSYWGRVGFIALIGFMIGFVSHAPYWNWFGFSTSYTLVQILDFTIGWSLAGLVIAKFAPGGKSVS